MPENPSDSSQALGAGTPSGSSRITRRGIVIVTLSDPKNAHDLYDKLYMMPINSQQYRPKDFEFWEAGNSATFRNAWMSSIQGGADWVQLVTWSDFSESGEI